jgi:plastocyanin
VLRATALRPSIPAPCFAKAKPLWLRGGECAGMSRPRRLKRNLIVGKAKMIRMFTRCVFTIAVVSIAYSARAADIEVKIDNFTFNPQQITVKAGTTVAWTNHDDIPHTVTSSTQVFRSKALDSDDKFSFTFTTPGTFKYFCSLHPHMTGSIVVEASGN